MKDKIGAIPRRKSIKFTFAEADPEKKIVSMIEWQGFIYVATEKGVYRIEENDTLVRLEMIDKTDER